MVTPDPPTEVKEVGGVVAIRRGGLGGAGAILVACGDGAVGAGCFWLKEIALRSRKTPGNPNQSALGVINARMPEKSFD